MSGVESPAENGSPSSSAVSLDELLRTRHLTIAEAVQILRGLTMAAMNAHATGQRAVLPELSRIWLRKPRPSGHLAVEIDVSKQAGQHGGHGTPLTPRAVQADLTAIGVLVARALLGIVENDATPAYLDQLTRSLEEQRPDVLSPLVEALRRTDRAPETGGFASARELLAACGELEPTRSIDVAKSAAGQMSTGSPLRVEDRRSSERADMEKKLSDEEHVANVLRLRKVGDIASFVWPSFFLCDWLMVTYIHPGEFWWYVVARGLAWFFPPYVAWRLRRSPLPTPAALARLDAYSFGSAGVAISAMCVMSGGMSSPYAAGLPVVLMSRNAFIAVPWRQSLISGGVAAFSYPVAQVIGMMISPELAAKLHDPAALSLFYFYSSLVFTAFFYTVAGGHAVWALRRQIFAARNLGRYRLMHCIGRGGMGEVWLAHHATLRRNVAVKIMRMDRSSPHALQRFEREVQATTSLTHPNTVRIFDYGATEDGLWYYAMEFLEGDDLNALVLREGALNQHRCLHIMLQVAGAMAEAHQQGVIHRDIKPANVFVCKAGGISDFVKVLDFGVAKLLDAEVAHSLTVGERMVGTPQYVSPEVALGQPADARSDVYALGGVLYFLLTGRPPFEHGEAGALLLAHAAQTPAPPSVSGASEVHPALEQLTLRCLAKKPADRYRDAGELERELRSVLEQLRG
ncbi:MAG: serine/threonine-protein kinase [Myxococcales bacterium]